MAQPLIRHQFNARKKHALLNYLVNNLHMKISINAYSIHYFDLEHITIL